MILEFDSNTFGNTIRELELGSEVQFTLRGRVNKLEAEMIDVSTYDKQDALHGKVTASILVTGIGAPK